MVRFIKEGCAVVSHCSDGWDRTSQVWSLLNSYRMIYLLYFYYDFICCFMLLLLLLVVVVVLHVVYCGTHKPCQMTSLSMVMLDPFYRTIVGFEV